MFTPTAQLRVIDTVCDPMTGFISSHHPFRTDDFPQVLQCWSLIEAFEDLSLHEDALVAGLPSPAGPAPAPLAGSQPLRSAAAWLARNTLHPLVPAFEHLLGSPHAFFLLGRQVLRRSADRNHVRVPGISGDLYVLREVASDLTDPGPSSSGLLGAVVDPSPETGLEQVRVVLWSMTDAEVDALLRGLP